MNNLAKDYKSIHCMRLPDLFFVKDMKTSYLTTILFNACILTDCFVLDNTFYNGCNVSASRHFFMTEEAVNKII